ncbi:hypothetical protein QBC46DRAFT_342500 [Diplogelasinospora grovesii]|uniref:Uncharacterized protein n=1 Tax=Diplogelasinospora grovesii TaxID=303347 RepID=A0AAN6N6N4_9PEZI|nr:hypothetical protein QBC46DRAFT_342500 [Diplogelasinospora grovesii]
MNGEFVEQLLEQVSVPEFLDNEDMRRLMDSQRGDADDERLVKSIRHAAQDRPTVP